MPLAKCLVYYRFQETYSYEFLTKKNEVVYLILVGVGFMLIFFPFLLLLLLILPFHCVVLFSIMIFSKAQLLPHVNGL
jgi:hypothetical protein